MYPVQVSSKTDEVPTLRGRSDIDHLVVVFTSFIISVVRATEIDKTSNTDFRPDLVGGFQHGFAGAHLKSDAIERIVAEDRSERARYALVLDKTAAPTARIDQPPRIEGVSRLAIIGQRILQQQ